jgi:hypothetical protein
LRITGWAANDAVHVSNGKAELYSMSSRALDHRRGVQGSKPSVEGDQGQDMNSVAPGFERKKEIGVLLTLSIIR